MLLGLVLEAFFCGHLDTMSLYALEISNATYGFEIYENVCNEWLVDFAQNFQKIPMIKIYNHLRYIVDFSENWYTI